MVILGYSNRVSNFVDAADVSGNIKNNRLHLQYLNMIDNTCIKAGIATGALHPIIGGHADSHKYNFLNPTTYEFNYFGTVNHSICGVNSNSGNQETDNIEVMMNPQSLYTDNITVFGFFTANGLNGGNGEAIGGVNSGNISLRLSGRYLLSNSTTVDGYSFSNPVGLNMKSLMAVRNEVTMFGLVNGNVIDTASPTNFGNTLCNRYFLLGIPSSGATTRSIGLHYIGPAMTLIKAKVFSHDIYIAQRSLGRA